MTIEDIEDVGSVLIVKVPDSKTDIQRTFTVTNLDYIELFRKYARLRPSHASNRRFFVKYRNGKCNNQVVGINTIGAMPSLIARYLELPDAEAYTGHCFRRTSATLLVDAGADITTLKRHGGWKSSTVAEGYIEDSMHNKIQISNKILDCEFSNSNVQPVESTSATATSASGINISQCNNCTINLSIVNN